MSISLARIEEIQQELLADDIDIDYVRCAASPFRLAALTTALCIYHGRKQ